MNARSAQVHKKERGKRATCKRKDKTSVKWEGKISPIHKQTFMHYSGAVQSGMGTTLLERKKKNIQCSLHFKTAALPQGKDPGKQLKAEASLQVKQHKRGLRFNFFRGQIFV